MESLQYLNGIDIAKITQELLMDAVYDALEADKALLSELHNEPCSDCNLHRIRNITTDIKRKESMLTEGSKLNKE